MVLCDIWGRRQHSPVPAGGSWPPARAGGGEKSQDCRRLQGRPTVQIKVRRIYNRGLQFYTYFGISIGIKRRMIDIGTKTTIYYLQPFDSH